MWSESGCYLVALGNIFTLRKLLKSKVGTTNGAVSLKSELGCILTRSPPPSQVLETSHDQNNWH